MAIGITEEQEELRTAVRRFVDARITPEVVRVALDADQEALPEFWPALNETGWLGVHVHDAGIVEQAVVVEELGRACAPGPYVPSAIVAAVLAAAAGGHDALLADVVAGTTPAAVALDGASLVVGGALAQLIICEVDGAWYALDASTLNAKPVDSIDRTRRLARIEVPSSPPADRKLAGITTDDVRALAAVMFAAEAIGVAQWCVDTASQYAAVRVQFGRPIGQFQGVKHRCAEMLARTELARAAVWDAARRRRRSRRPGRRARDRGRGRARVRRRLRQRQGLRADARRHRVHVGTRRAHLSAARDDAAPSHWHARRLARTCRACSRDGGARRRLAVDLPADAGATYRAEVRGFLEDIKDVHGPDRRARLAAEGYVTPGWPKPWGRDAQVHSNCSSSKRSSAPRRCSVRTSVSARGRCRT